MSLEPLTIHNRLINEFLDSKISRLQSFKVSKIQSCKVSEAIYLKIANRAERTFSQTKNEKQVGISTVKVTQMRCV